MKELTGNDGLARRPTWSARVMRRLLSAAGLCFALAAPVAATDDGVKVTIEGGCDESGHNYQWTVTNHHTSPIVSVEFPHYHVDRFEVPEGWSREGTTNAIGRGSEDEPGVCRATAVPPNHGIARRRAEVFKARVRPKGAWRGKGTVTVLFADGSTAAVAGVALPQSEPKAEKYTRVIGYGVLGTIFLVVVAVRARKRRSEGSEKVSG